MGVALGAGGVALSTLGGDDDGAAGPTATTTPPSSVATTVPVAPTATPTPTPAPTTAAPDSGSEATTTTTTTTPPVREVIVVVGLNDGPERVDVVPVGSPVELRLTNPTADDEFHLHGYDLGGDLTVPAGETLTLNFVADRTGLFEVESHVTGDVLVVLLVE